MMRVGYKGFNSIKVRLRREQSCLTPMIEQFQFHKGAIKTKYTIKDYTAKIAFQFHKGAIKTTASHGSRCLIRVSIP